MCNNNKNHCHKCEKAKHWDFFFAVVFFAIIGLVLYLGGLSAFTYVPWYLWVLLGAILLGGVMKWHEKKQQKKKEKQKKH